MPGLAHANRTQRQECLADQLVNPGNFTTRFRIITAGQAVLANRLILYGYATPAAVDISCSGSAGVSVTLTCLVRLQVQALPAFTFMKPFGNTSVV